MRITLRKEQFVPAMLGLLICHNGNGQKIGAAEKPNILLPQLTWKTTILTVTLPTKMAIFVSWIMSRP